MTGTTLPVPVHSQDNATVESIDHIRWRESSSRYWYLPRQHDGQVHCQMAPGESDPGAGHADRTRPAASTRRGPLRVHDVADADRVRRPVSSLPALTTRSLTHPHPNPPLEGEGSIFCSS